MVIPPVGRSNETSTKTVQSSFSKAQIVPFVTYVDAKKQEVTRIPTLRALYPCTLELKTGRKRRSFQAQEVARVPTLRALYCCTLELLKTIHPFYLLKEKIF